MKLLVSYHQVDHSKALDEYISKKSKRLEKLSAKLKNVRFVISKKGREYSASLKIAGKGVFESSESNPFKAVEKVLRKAARSIRELKDRKHRGYVPALAYIKVN